jgi:hypothetical protein
MSTLLENNPIRAVANDGQIFELCRIIWQDDIMHPAFIRVGLNGYFDRDEYDRLHRIISSYWEKGKGVLYRGDLLLCEAIIRHVAADIFDDFDSPKARDFIKIHRPKRQPNGTLLQADSATVDELLDLIGDLKKMIGIKEFCNQSKVAIESGDRDEIEKIQSKEHYLTERFRRKRGFMDKLGYGEVFAVLCEVVSGDIEDHPEELRRRIEQSLQFLKY